MPNDRTEGRRAGRRTFQPTLDGRLEPRLLLSQGGSLHIAARRLAPAKVFVASGGQLAKIVTGTAERFQVSVTGAGTVRAYPMTKGRVGLVIEGTSDLSQVDISPLSNAQRRGLAHQFPANARGRSPVLGIGAINVVTGEVGSITGYHTATLSGPLTIGGTGTVDRIAFQALEPGASIAVAGTLNTLDVLGDADIRGGPGISVGVDFNSFSVGRNLTLSDGADVIIGRDLGPTGQPAKGTGPAGQGIAVEGNLVIAPGSEIRIGRDMIGSLFVDGNADIGAAGGAPRITIGRNLFGNITVRGTLTS